MDLLEGLDAPAYKIASFEAVDTPLIRCAARTGKPLIISTGMANEAEIAAALAAARKGGAKDVVLLHCVSGYPAPPGDYNLATIPDMAARFGVPVGLSDHTLGTATAVASVALGACVIEKHVTLDRSRGGPDDAFSLEPPELKALVRDARIAWEALGRPNYERTESEKGNVQFRRSLYFVRDLRKGEAVTPDAVRSVRPGFGLPPAALDEIIGRTAAQDIAANTAVTWEALGGQ